MSHALAAAGIARSGTRTGSFPAVFVTLAAVLDAAPTLVDAVLRHELGIEGTVEVAERILAASHRLRTREERPVAFELYLVVAAGDTVSPMPVLDLHVDRVALAAALRAAGLPLREEIPFLDSVAGYTVLPDGRGGRRLEAAQAAEGAPTARPHRESAAC